MSLLELWEMLSPDMKLAVGSTLVMCVIGYIGSKCDTHPLDGLFNKW